MKKILAIDIGTSRVKAALIDRSGSLSALASRRVVRTDSPDFQSAEAWYDLVCACIRELPAEPLEALALTGNMHALLPVDESGVPIGETELWCSNLSVAESDRLSADCGEVILARTGNPVTPVFTLPKILRMKKERPSDYARTKYFLQVKDYIAYRLTGEFVSEGTDASGTLLYRLDTRQWDLELISALDLNPHQFPRVLASTDICGRIRAQAAADCSLPEGLPVIIGSGDLSSAALGAGTGRDTLSLTLGTAGQLLATGTIGSYPALANKLFAFVHADPESELYLGSVPGGGFSLEWAAKNMIHCSMDEFFAIGDSRKIFPGDLPVFLPYLLGRGAPYMDYIPCGRWVGLKASHDAVDIVQGAILGTLCALRQSCDLLESLDHPFETVVLQSLANREAAVRRAACALFTQKNKVVPVNPEASLLGAAMIGAVGCGIWSTFAEARQNMVHGELLEPVADENITAAQSYYKRYLDAADQVRL